MHSDAPQGATVGTSQAEHVIVTDTPSRHSVSAIPVVDLDDNHISEGTLNFGEAMMRRLRRRAESQRTRPFDRLE